MMTTHKATLSSPITLALFGLLLACSSADVGPGTGEGTGAPSDVSAAEPDAQGAADSQSSSDLDVSPLGDDLGSDEAADTSSDEGDTGDTTEVEASADTLEEDADPLIGYAYLVVEPPAIDFGQRIPGEVITEEIELENAGTRELLIETVGFTLGIDAFGVNVSQASLGPGQTKVVKVTFYADEEGVFEDTLRFESDAINDPELDVDIIGEVIQPVCQDLDGDGHGLHCALGSDCNESDPNVHFGAPEKCNGQDDDCDGLHDEDYVGLGSACEVGLGACTSPGVKICASDEASLTCSVNPTTGGNELCNELDDDCDGATDEDFPSKNLLCTVGVGACTNYDKFICAEDGQALICNVSPGEPTDELCDDGTDNDCDGIIDEGMLEVCDDGIDNDCDGETDESGSLWGEVFFARDYYYDTVAITPSNGDGTFQEPIPLIFPDDNRYSVYAVGDFNGDFYLDLVVSRTLVGEKIICSSTDDCGPGRRCYAGACETLCTSDAQCDLTLGEVCIDVTAPGQSNKVTDSFCMPPRDILMAVSSCEGDGIELTHLFTQAPGERLGPVIDADGNGHLDFVGLNHWSNPTGFIRLNDGQGGFTRVDDAFNYGSLITWAYAVDFQSKDLDGDGIVDLLAHKITSGGSSPMSLYRLTGQGDGTFSDPVALSEKAPYPANLIIADDFDGDGDHDVMAGLDDDGQPGAAWMLMNLDAPTGDAWVPPYEIVDVVPTYNSGGDHPGVGSGASYDFDGDRRPDLLLAWIPEECGSYIWGCTQISDPAHICYGGSCRKIGYLSNKTANPCVAGTSCVDGSCQLGCEADCTGKQCGDDGCSGSCGTCGGGQICASGQCVVDCVPDCEGKSCGDNGCGGICGACAQGESCLQGACQAGCVPSCQGKSCGDDGCGGSCAVFEPPVTIAFDDNPKRAIRTPINVPPTTPEVAIQPAEPTADDDLLCAITTPSVDSDLVTYRTRWTQDGVFVKAIGESPSVPAALTSAGEVWACSVRATDGVEWSREVGDAVTIAPGAEPEPSDADAATESDTSEASGEGDAGPEEDTP